ncbi:MAG: tRNA pseudouridine(55) synthase TruB [Leptospiraceae bacterium]|nr:tRNA pseudouridine(55) synthase TruB [Leptospiraceae bacterium]MCK6379759.1 tRNA pseudouridine(55) synthase TruB [Leptospiraceae bacterium]
MNFESGFLLVNKPKNMTSSSVVLEVKKLIKKKIGHTGTLDKFAEGLLILPFGDCTHFSSIFLEMEKKYSAEIEFGKATDSGDIDGKILEEWDFEKIHSYYQFHLENIIREIDKIQDIKKQTPPKISALKINGVRQAELFRKGVEFESISREISISNFFYSNLSAKGFSMSLTVSSGTYIRKLIMDLFENTGLPMFISKLIRTGIGNTDLSESNLLESIKEGKYSVKKIEEIIDIASVLIDKKEETLVSHGGYINILDPNTSKYGFLLKNEKQEIVAWCDFSGKKSHLPYKYNKVFVCV